MFRYEERLAAFMQKLDQINALNNDANESVSSRSDSQASKFLMKLGECMQNTDISKTTSPIQKDQVLAEAKPQIHLEPVIESRLELTLSKRDRIAALKAKSESFQVNGF